MNWIQANTLHPAFGIMHENGIFQFRPASVGKQSREKAAENAMCQFGIGGGELKKRKKTYIRKERIIFASNVKILSMNKKGIPARKRGGMTLYIPYIYR